MTERARTNMLHTFMRAEMARAKKEERLDELEADLAGLHLEHGISFGDMAEKLRAAQTIQIELARMAINRERGK